MGCQHHRNQKKRKKKKKKKKKEKKKKDYTFRRQFNEKPSIIPGCPRHQHHICMQSAVDSLLGAERMA